jgi:hypothetical protein
VSLVNAPELGVQSPPDESPPALAFATASRSVQLPSPLTVASAVLFTAMGAA